MKNIISISGPSGIGKTTALGLLNHDLYQRVTSSTTRIRRDGETSDVYRFLTTEEYLTKRDAKEMALSFYFFGNFYGYQRTDIDNIVLSYKVPILEIYTEAIDVFKNEIPNSISFFLMPENLQMLKRRMLKRGDNMPSIEQRLSKVEQEILLYYKNQHLFNQKIIVGEEEGIELVVKKLIQAFSLFN